MLTSGGSGDVRAHAESALALAQSDPARAEALAADAFTRAMATGDHHSASIAARARGLAARERHDLRTSLVYLRQAVRVAEGNGLAACAGQARLSLAGTLAVRGEWVAALREADLAEPALTGVDHARLQVQRSYVLRMHGQLAEAMEGFRRALPALRRHGDTLWEARLHANRGLGHYQLGDLASAEADLRRADELYRSLGQGRLAASARQNLGMVVGLRGDIPAALTWFEEADRYFAERGQVDAMSLNDRCLVLLQARLVPDALRAAEKAVELLAQEGRLAYLAQAQLKLAEAALLAGNWAAARTGAEEARRAFAKQRRPAWSALARLVAARAAWAAGDHGPAVFDAARRAADVLAASGFAIAELDARLLAAQVAIAGNSVAAARRQLALAHGARTRGTVQVRTRAWHAEALLRLQDGDRRRALAAVRAGMDLLDRYRGALGATELRAHASGHATDLATLGLRLALERGRATSVLDWSERFRAGALRMRPVRPPDDAPLAAALGELRAVVTQVERAALGGQPLDALVARQGALEETVTELARHADTSRFSPRSVEPRRSLAELADALGDTALVEFVDCDGTLHAVLLADGRARLYRLAPRTAVASEIDSLRFSFRRLAFRHGTPASLAGAADAAALAAKRLDGLLFAPLGARIGVRPLVVVPTGVLHALPWSALPSCVGRPVSVAPSAAVWHRAATAPPSADSGPVVLVAGPDVPNSAPEVAALARRYPGAVTLTGRRATCNAVCRALDGARLAHVAAHGRFRADNALFSSLQLVDGPLTVYDLEALRQPPSALVLSSCDSGASDVRPGDELMGLAAALLSLGTRTVVASVFPVPDDATRRFMLAFHRALDGGHGPAEALARAQSESHDLGSVDGSGDQTGAVTAAAFVCLGAGGRRAVAHAAEPRTRDSQTSTTSSRGTKTSSPLV